MILLGNALVLFTKDLGMVTKFSSNNFTDHVVIEDEGRPGIYLIKEVQTSGSPDNKWIVDTNKKFHVLSTDHNGKMEHIPAYLIESQIPKGYDGATPGSILSQHASGNIQRSLMKR